MRDEFSQNVKESLAKRVGYLCSNPNCRHSTSGPQQNSEKAVNVGAASHITAASFGGPRFDCNLTPEQRGSFDNGIWLCQTCGKLIDSDVNRYTVDVLREWKVQAELNASDRLEGKEKVPDSNEIIIFEKLEKLMPVLLEEMRDDLKKNPLHREFVLFKRVWSYNGDGNQILFYYYDDHPDLDNKIRILENCHLIQEITYNNVKRYRLSEDIVEYLTK